MGWTIEARNIWFSYIGREYVIKDVSFKAEPGYVTSIIGPTGCGKSTLIFLLAGLLKPKKGTVLYNNLPLEKIFHKVRREIGVLFQNPDDQLFNPTVYDEIAYSLRTLGIKEDEIKEKVKVIAEKMKITSLLGRSPFRLSVGEKKKVALASILIYDPNILFLDEPTSNLSSADIEFLNKIVWEAKDKGRTVIVASHDLEFALQNADYVYILNKGEIKVKCRNIGLLRKDIIEKAGLKHLLLFKIAKELNVSHNTLLSILKKLRQKSMLKK